MNRLPSSDQSLCPGRGALLCARRTLRNGHDASRAVSMPNIPKTSNSPLIRTDFSDEAAWREIVVAARQTNEDGFRAYFDVIDDVAFDGASPEDLAAAASAMGSHSLLIVADKITTTDGEHPVLCIDLLDSAGS